MPAPITTAEFSGWIPVIFADCTAMEHIAATDAGSLNVDHDIMRPLLGPEASSRLFSEGLENKGLHL